MAAGNSRQLYINFDEYQRQGEPSRREAAYAWATAIGLQAVDGLTTSAYLHQLARRNIEGEISIDEVQQLARSYYESRRAHDENNEDKEEADRVSANIVKVLAQPTFAFNTNGFISIHRRIFDGVFKHAGRLRDYDITKKEWVLGGDTVQYLNWEDLRRALDYDLAQEREFDYTRLAAVEFCSHLSRFVSGLWQIHPFSEGNTRATAVFTIQYLRYLGFAVDNDLFEKHSWYFRNALVRANYSNYNLKVNRTTKFLELFFRNLIFGEQNELRNRYLLIEQLQPDNYTPTGTPTSTPTSEVPQHFNSVNELVVNLIKVIGKEELSIKEILARANLRDRKNLFDYHLKPAIETGFVRLKFTDKPSHPRQKYLLTVKGLMMYNQLITNI